MWVNKGGKLTILQEDQGNCSVSPAMVESLKRLSNPRPHCSDNRNQLIRNFYVSVRQRRFQQVKDLVLSGYHLNDIHGLACPTALLPQVPGMKAWSVLP
jgi:hypothetical protein